MPQLHNNFNMGAENGEPSSSRQGVTSNQKEDEYAFDVPDEEDDDDEDDNDDIESPMADTGNEKVRFKNPFPSPPVIELRGREVVFAIAVFFLLSTCVGLIIIMASGLAKISGGKGDKSPPRQDCVTKQCLFAAARLLDNMDSTVEPCDDFFTYACGGWNAQHQIPHDYMSWSVDKEIERRINTITRELIESPIVDTSPQSAERKAKTLYSRCMDIEAIDSLGAAPIVHIMGKYGGWALKGDWDPDTAVVAGWDFQRALEDLHYIYWADVFFTFWVSPDDKQSDRIVVQFDQQGLGLSDPNYYSMNESTSPLVAAYKKMMRDIARLFNATDSEIEDFVEATFDFEKQLAEITVPEHSPERQNPENIYNPLTVAELQELAPAIDWLHMLRGNFHDTTNNTPLVVANKNYMRGISALISRTSDRVLNYYMMWRTVSNFAVDLSKPFRKAVQDFEGVEKGKSSRRERWKYCMQIVNDWMGNAIGSMFVKKYFPKKSKDHVVNMINGIREAFHERLRNNQWMDNSTRNAAAAKLSAMEYKIGYPDFLANDSEVNQHFANMIVEDDDTYFQLQLNGIKFDLLKMIHDYETQATNKQDWGMNPHEVNAYYAPTENLMLFPAGILQTPYFDDKVPDYMNFGGIGSTIGHELTHGFDLYGSRYDANGNMVDWWSPESWSKFQNNTKCVSDYYSTLSLGGVNVDGEQTLGENIADIGGLLQTYYAYKSWQSKSKRDEKMLPGLDQTPTQLFFLSFAQNWCNKRSPSTSYEVLLTSTHAPAEIRVKGTLSQMKEFSDAFKCKRGAPMNPEPKCTVW